LITIKSIPILYNETSSVFVAQRRGYNIMVKKDGKFYVGYCIEFLKPEDKAPQKQRQ